MFKQSIFFVLLVLFATISVRGENVSLDDTYVAAVSPDDLPHSTAKLAAKKFINLRTGNQARLVAQVLGLIQIYKQKTYGFRSNATHQGDLAAVLAADKQLDRIDATIKTWTYDVPSRDLPYRLITPDHAHSALGNDSHELKDGLDQAYRNYFEREHQAVSDFADHLGRAITLLIRSNDLENASLLETKMSHLQSESQKLLDLAHEGGWQVVFRSSDPSIWNTDTRKAEDNFAVSLGSNLAFSGFVRIVRMDTGQAIILRLATKNITDVTQMGRYIWNGASTQESKRVPDGSIVETRLLGIADTSLKLSYRSPYYATVNLSGRGNGYGGWGFARQSLLYSNQRYAWDKDQPEKSVVFEIALKTQPLSTSESESLLNPLPASPSESQTSLAIAKPAPFKADVLQQAKVEETDAISTKTENMPAYSYRYDLRLIGTGGGTSRFTIYSNNGSTSNGEITSSKYDHEHINFHGFFRNDNDKPYRFQFEIRIVRKSTGSIGFSSNKSPQIIGRAIHKTGYLQPGEIEEFDRIIAVPEPWKLGAAAIGNVKAFSH